MLGGVERPSLPPSREGVAPVPRPPHTDWNQVDVGKLILDLDEDIRNSEMGSRENSPPRTQSGIRPTPPVNHNSTRPPSSPMDDNDKSLKLKIKRTKSGRQEIVKPQGGSKSPAFNGNFDSDPGGKSGNGPPSIGNSGPPFKGTGPLPTSLSGPHQNSGNGPLYVNSISVKTSVESGSQSFSGSGRSSIVGSGPPSNSGSYSGSGSSAGGSNPSYSGDSCPPSGDSSPPSPQIKHESTAVQLNDMTWRSGTGSGSNQTNSAPPPNPSLQQNNNKKLKVDVGTVTDASTLTEPEILGPCEPGTAVNLEGIVWHETDTGVLVVNITWKGKTYVGTLLDCARHTNQWSAPRFTDSPEPGGKGRGKRGRTTSTPLEPEPRKNLRSSKAKGKGKGSKSQQQQAQIQEQQAAEQTEDEFNFPTPASPAKDGTKRKKEPELDEMKKRKRTSSDSDDSSAPTEEFKPTPTVKREPKPDSFSYKMLNCPRKDCSKQYKHDDGLKWHVSHSHPEFIGADGEIRDSSEVEKEEQEKKRKNRSKEEKEERKKKEGKENSDKGTPAKQPKLDESNKSTPVTELKNKQFTPQQQQQQAQQHGQPHQRPGNLQVRPGLYTPPTNGKYLDPTDDLKNKSRMIESPAGSPAPPNGTPNPLLAGSPSQDREKPAANSPAYSDISDDGEDSRGKDLKLPQGITIPSPQVSSSSSFSSPQLVRSSPMPRTESSMITTTPSGHRTSSYGLTGSNSGPQVGTQEYHKYLAANGFPPFPYPYPVGMDPNFHIQLLKTDPLYKSKWEKDRADRERAFKEQLDKDQGKFSSLSLGKDDRLQGTPPRKPDGGKPEDLRKREPSGDNRPRSRASPMTNMISVKPEFREKEDVKREIKSEEGVKPTMETRGPPPGPQTFGYMHPSLLRPPFSLGGMAPPFEPLFVSAGGLSPYGLPPGPNPYLSPAHLSSVRPPVPFSFGDPMMRAPFPLGAEDLARAAAGAPPGLSGTKALDLLQQHATQYYANQKLVELQERALKSPISSMSSVPSMGLSLPKPITTLAGKDSPTNTSAGDKSKSPPPLRHVHTHTHTHIGLGYPLLPPGALPPVPGGMSPVSSLPPGALPPPSIGFSSVPYSGAGGTQGKPAN